MVQKLGHLGHVEVGDRFFSFEVAIAVIPVPG